VGSRKVAFEQFDEPDELAAIEWCGPAGAIAGVLGRHGRSFR
jgi:hypothetical protein